MFWKAALVWIGNSVLAIANGFLREAVLKRLLGERMAHVASTILLAAIVLVVSFVAGPWIGVSTLDEAWALGFGWLAATLAFEFLAGHYLFGNPWSKIVADYDATKGRVWPLVPLCTLVGPPLAFKGIDAKWAIPYAVSNLVAVAILFAAVTRPRVARWAIVVLFAYAAVYNTWLGRTRPEEYQGFAVLALVPWYRDFIEGPLRDNGSTIIPAIGIGQALCALLLALGGRFAWAGAIGVCTFLLAIVPLGVGSAVPFSFLVSLAAIAAVGSITASCKGPPPGSPGTS
jgi:hypothetical protein